jgi:hypothetical protein
VTSNKRLSDLETLQDFLQSATNELIWLNEKEEVELSRDWSDKNLNIPAIEQYYEVRRVFACLHCWSHPVYLTEHGSVCTFITSFFHKEEV